MLLDRMAGLAQTYWTGVFAQSRSVHRAVSYGLGLLVAIGRRTVTSSIAARGLEHQDWSGDYKLLSRSRWDAADLFAPALKTFLERFPSGLIPVALDETKVRKTGAKIPHVSWQRDPLSPPFANNFIRALRYIQASLLYPFHRDHQMAARGVPVAFVAAPVVKRPGHRATDEEKTAYRIAIREQNLSTQSLELVEQLRARFDRAGASERFLIFAMDGSFCNRTMFSALLERTHLIARARKDAKLCRPALPGSRRWYDEQTFTPEQVRSDDSIAFSEAIVRLGHQLHTVRFKELSGILWRSGARRRPLRLLVISPPTYHVRGYRGQFRKPAFLLTTDLTTPAAALIQIYVDRWQIEVNHRDEKDLLGVGQAQVWSPNSALRAPTFSVALYSLLLVASFIEFGPTRSSAFSDLPKWRSPSARPSLLDLLRLLRKQINEPQISPPPFATTPFQLVAAANA